MNDSSWVVVKLTEVYTNKVVYKVLYDVSTHDEFKWSVNSGITHVEVDSTVNRVTFHGESGSVYSFSLLDYRLSNATINGLSMLIKLAQDQFLVEVMPEKLNWDTLV